MSAPHSKTDALLTLARRGPVRARDLDEHGIPRSYLRRLCERGLLERVDRGLYRLADDDVSESSGLADVAIRVPHGVVCLYSALQFHGLTTEVPAAVWIMIPRRARRPTIESPQIEIVRASGAAYTHGVEPHVIDGVDVRITTPAKTVADCFRYEAHVGLDTALDALRDLLRRSGGRTNDLVAAARADQVLQRMRPYLEALV